MPRRLLFALLALAGPAFAQDKAPPPAPVAAPVSNAVKVEMTDPVFEMFRLAPGKTEAFIRDMAAWDKVSEAGGQPATQLFLHEGGEGWDVLLYKPSRPKPTAAQNAVMAAKAREMGLPTGALYFVALREQVADHAHFDAIGPMKAADWVAELDRQRAELRQRK